ncbi:MAG TPA: hypothetical protein VFF73_14705 [Planctomycetota bacterium]|nr:hypothetical protein [Planctomycetota bacterium]
MRAPGIALALVLVAAPALAQDRESLDRPAREALVAVSRGLVLAAADDANKAAELAGPSCPADLSRDFEAIHASSRAKDLRDAPNARVKQALLKTLMDETPEARDVERRLTELAARLASELDDIVTRSAKAKTEAAQLHSDALEGKYLSPAAVNAGKAGPMGPLLLRLAKAAPFLADDVRADGTFDARYRVLARAYERAPDAQAELLLSILASVEAKGKIAGAEVSRLVQLVRARLDEARDATIAALGAAKDAALSLRQGELAKAVLGTRAQDLEYGVKILAAYRKQFNATPALDATEIAGVYVDRNLNRIYFYVDAEDRWIEGAAHAAPLMPATMFLRTAKDASLVRRATDPRALAALYLAFGDKVPFETGLEKALKTAQAVCARARALEAVAREGGATPEQLDRFFAERGYDRALAGPFPGLDDAACARRAMERLAHATIDGAPGIAQALASALDAAQASLESVRLLAFTDMRLEAPVTATFIALSLRAPGLALAPLVPPPRMLVPLGTARCVLVVQKGEDARGAAIEAEAWSGADPLVGRLELDVAKALEKGVASGQTIEVKSGSALGIEGKRGAKVRAGERVHARLRPARVARLKLQGPSGEDETGAWTLRGGEIEPTAAWSAGTWTATALDESDKPLASCSFEVEKAKGIVCEDASGARVVYAHPGTSVVLHCLECGKDVAAGQVTVVLEHQAHGVAWAPDPVACPKATLDLPADLAPGRYRLVAQLGDARVSWPLGIVKDEPTVSLVRDPFGVEPRATIGAGERLYARIEPGFAFEASRVASAFVQLDSPARGPGPRTAARPVPGFPATSLLVPIALKDSLPPLSWDVVADVSVGLAKVRAKGKVQIEAGAEMPFALRPEDGLETRTLLARGDRALVKLSDTAGIVTATFVVVGPDGLAVPLEPDEQGSVRVTVAADAAIGAWELRGAARQDGSVLYRSIPFQVYAPARFTVSVKGKQGEQPEVTIPLPPGYEEPVRVRAGSVWTDGRTVTIPIEGARSVALVLEDKNGRRATGEALVEVAVESKDGRSEKKGPRYAVLASLSRKEIFFPSFDSISAAVRDSKLNADWVVIDTGPLTPADARDWVWSHFPYDAPHPGGAASAYRSQRGWKTLSPSVQARLAAGGCSADTVFDIMNSPAAEDDAVTLETLARRIASEKGGWTYELESVKVKGTAAVADGTAFKGASFTLPDAGSVTRVVVPGVMADLDLATDLPAKLVLGQPFALSVSAQTVSAALEAGRAYPLGLEKVASKLLHAVLLEGSLDLEGKTIAVPSSQSLGVGSAGRELVFTSVPTGTDKTEDGSARMAENHSFAASPPGAGAPLDLRLEPVMPGALANKPARLVARFKARIVLGIPESEWPKDRPRPIDASMTVNGERYVVGALDRTQVPQATVEVEVSYVRQSTEGGTPVAAKPALAPSRVGGAAPVALDPVDVAAELQAATNDEAASNLESAAVHARRALHGDPARADSWLALGALLAKGHVDEAVAPLARAAAAGTDGKALVLDAEALAATGRNAESVAAARRALGLTLDDALKARAKKIVGE